MLLSTTVRQDRTTHLRLFCEVSSKESAPSLESVLPFLRPELLASEYLEDVAGEAEREWAAGAGLELLPSLSAGPGTQGGLQPRDSL